MTITGVTDNTVDREVFTINVGPQHPANAWSAAPSDSARWRTNFEHRTTFGIYPPRHRKNVRSAYLQAIHIPNQPHGLSFGTHKQSGVCIGYRKRYAN